MDNEDIWRKLQEMDNKLDLIQGDVNTQATVMKVNSKDQLVDLAQRKFGRSKNKRIIWYYADEKRTVDGIAERSGLSKSSIYNHTAEMCEKSLIFKIEEGDTARYKRQETTEGIGLEEHVEEFVDDL
jgi:predicted transcriptional regulator